MQSYDDPTLLTGALSSEKAYFRLGAREWESGGAYIAIMPGLEQIPAASVCILDVANREATKLRSTVAEAEAYLRKAGVITARIYTGETTAAFGDFLSQSGYRRRTETIHAFFPLPHLTTDVSGVRWHRVETDDDWKEKAAIHAIPSTASDGYDISPENWLSIERRKSEAGELSFWLYSDEGRPVATTGLIRCAEGGTRIKNFFVSADCRGKGVGKAALESMLRQLAAGGERAAVLLSIAASAGERLYHSVGARDIGCIYEWSRTL